MSPPVYMGCPKYFRMIYGCPGIWSDGYLAVRSKASLAGLRRVSMIANTGNAFRTGVLLFQQESVSFTAGSARSAILIFPF